MALGDSFAMGYGTDGGDTWTNLLSTALGEPVYNAGVSSTGPRQHLLLLEHLLETHRDSIRVEHVLWMIFEGNDLENSYADARPTTDASRSPAIFEGTLVATALSLPGIVKNGSVLRKVLAVLLDGLARRDFVPGGLEIEGLQTPYPLYHSDTPTDGASASSIRWMWSGPRKVRTTSVRTLTDLASSRRSRRWRT